jgi:NIMA (never in mitosis gene a)-related kinase 1/4/5
MVSALKSLHEHNILHRDIKSANIFISKDSKSIKLGDLNVSKLLKKGLVHTQTGTPYYASPEVWRDEPYDFKSDLWSLGCVIYEMASLKPPFRALNMEGLYKKVVRGIYERIPAAYSQELSNMIALLL